MMLFVVLLAILGCSIPVVSSSLTPLTPTQYQSKMCAGFATNYFKTLNFAKYNRTNVQHVYDRGFRNLRLRCRADLDGLNMTVFLNNLETVVDDCLEIGVLPIISWIHHQGEAFANETHRLGYLQWWQDVANKLKDKDYRLSFNLFTELGVDYCNEHGVGCTTALALNKDTYNNWTADVIQVIRATGGKNLNRTIIMASPKKTGKFLRKIDSSIYENDSNLMAEWHIFASGPNKVNGSAKEWYGDGSSIGQNNVDKAFEYATNWTRDTNVPTYLAAWMPQDNKDGSINQTEAILFSRYFINNLRPIPWSLNVLDVYYNTSTSEWINDEQPIRGTTLNMSAILTEITMVMPTNC